MSADELAALLTRLGVQGVRQRGSNIQANCMYHSESRPSWGISTSPPHLHGCFACGKRGNLVTLLQHLGQSRAEAMRLADDMPAEFGLKKFGPKKHSAPTIDYTELFTRPLTRPALLYLLNRGLSKATITAARLGFDPQMQRVLFPWYLNGTLTGVTGRTISPTEKVKTLPLFGTKKGQSAYLPAGKISPEPLFVVEGEIDALKIFDAGIPNVMALGFGSGFTPVQKSLVLNSGTALVVAFTDHDPTGFTLGARIKAELAGLVTALFYDYADFNLRPDEKLDPGAIERDKLKSLCARLTATAYSLARIKY